MSGVKGLEQSLKWDKKKAERAMEELIYQETASIVGAMIDHAKEGSFQHASYLLDRGFGKPKQSVGLENPDGSPIIFMPAALITKFALDKPIDAEKVEEPNVYEAKEKDQ